MVQDFAVNAEQKFERRNIMASDLFGGLFKGLSGFMPDDDPDSQIFKLTNEFSDLQQKEIELYAQIGKKAIELYPNEKAFADIFDELRILKRKQDETKQRLEKIKTDKEKKEQEMDLFICPECGEENEVGTKFCQGCGAKLSGNTHVFCSSCGAENKVGVKFCGECGAKL